MPRQISKKVIVSTILEGFSDAQNSYEKWTGGFWLWKAPEYLISATVARAIAEIDGAKFVTLEHGATSTLEVAGAKGVGRLEKNIREDGRVDILVWWGGDTPRAVIEIKNQIYAIDQYRKDIERITSMLKRNSHDSSLEFGVFAFYESATDGEKKSAEQKIRDRVERIHSNCIEIAGESFSVSKPHMTDIHIVGESAWAAACLVITPSS